MEMAKVADASGEPADQHFDVLVNEPPEPPAAVDQSEEPLTPQHEQLGTHDLQQSKRAVLLAE